MATYNGEAYLNEQIDSILNQEDVIVDVLVADDCSQDRTAEILKSYSDTNKNFSYSVNLQNKGFAKNFIDLIYDNIELLTKFDYIALSDQDDVWLPNKLIEAVIKLEAKPDKNFYCSNLTLVDKNLRLLKQKQPSRFTETQIFIENICTGCTIVFNGEFVKHIKKYRPNIYLHDYWLFLISVIFNSYIYDPQAFILYRQHDNNQIGMSKKNKPLFRRIKDFYREIFVRNKRKHSDMLRQLLQVYKDEMNEDLCDYMKVLAYPTLRNRLKIIFSKKYKKQSFKENFIFKARVLLNKN